MIERIISFSISNKLIVGFFTILLILTGLYALQKLPIDAVPDITNNQVQIITRSPSLGAPDVERLVTFPIEQACSNIPGIEELRSFSRFGLSVVTIVFSDETDVYLARQQVSERLQSAINEIPKGAGIPELGPVTTGLGEIFQYVVRTKPGYENRYSATELRSIQDWIIRKQLLGTPGVADISSFGGYLKQYEVAVDPGKLQAQQLTLNEVFQALASNNENTGGAYIEKGPQVVLIRSEGLLKNLDEIGAIPVKKGKDGIPVLMRDVAEIRIGHATRYGAMTYNGEGEVTGAVVMMLKGENSSAVIKSVKERIAKIQKALPEGVIIEPFLDRDKMVGKAIGTVKTNLMEGALIVVFVLVLFLGNWRAGLVVASVIPLAMLFAVILMNLFGVSGNLMSLGALDFGLIVDGAVIIIEAVLHSLHKMPVVRLLNRDEMNKAVKESAGRMMNAAMFGQAVILVVYLPILSLSGIEGKMFRPMAQTVAFAILGAFILSLTYVPMMSAWLMEKKTGPSNTWSDRMMHWLEVQYQKGLSLSLHYRKVLAMLAVILFAASAFLLTRIGGEFIPELEEGDFAVDSRVLTGSNLQTSIRNTQHASKILLEQFDEVEKVVVKTGSGEIPTDPMPIEASDMMVILKDKHEWKNASSFDELAEKMSKALQAIPGLSTGFQFPVQMRFNELMTGARQDVVCKIYGENIDSLVSYAERIGAEIRNISGAKDLYLESMKGMPQVVVSYHREALARYGLNVEEINRSINAGFAGAISGKVFEEEKRFDLVVRLQSDARADLRQLENLPIQTPSGSMMPLRQLAKVELIDGPAQIQRENFSRRITIGFNVRNRDISSVVNDLQKAVAQKIKLPPGYYIHYGGTFENMQKATARLSIAVPLALGLIMFLLYLAFGSLRLGLLIFSAIPLSAIGGILALALRGMPFSISAGIGFIALFGVAVLNGIVLITEYNRLIRSGRTDLLQLVMEGTTNRLRPVLMTASVAAFGFLPMALSTGAGAEVQKPLATVVIGGLISATFLTLFLLPGLYLLFNRKAISVGVTPVLLAMLLGTSTLQAQSTTKLGLEEAIQLAIKRNEMLQETRMHQQSVKAMEKGWLSLPETEISAEYGQINTYYADTRFGIRQAMDFPSVYGKNKQLLKSQTGEAAAALQLNEAELIQEVRKLWYRQQILREKIRNLEESGKVMEAAEARSKLRQKTGESNQLETYTYTGKAAQQLTKWWEAKSELRETLLKFNRLLADSTTYQADSSDWIFRGSSAAIQASPLLKLSAQQEETRRLEWKLTQAKALPGFSFSYNNMSIVGWQQIGNDMRYFNASRRFHSGSIGLSVPLFYGASRASIAAAKIAWMQAGVAQERIQNQISQEIRTKREVLDNLQQQLERYEQIILPSALNAQKLAQQQLQLGEINYLEWVVLYMQQSDYRLEYLELCRKYNEAAFEISYLTGN